MTEGLKKAIEIIEKEIITAKDINPIMAFGMQHVKLQIQKELEEQGE